MNREQIYDQLREQIPNLTRRDCTRRVMEATDILLDQLLEVQYDEAIEILEEEANGEG